MRRIGFVLLTVFSMLVLAGCQKQDGPPAPLTPEQERQMQEQMKKARQAEGASQQQAK